MHAARVLLAELGIRPDEPPWGADLGGYAAQLVVSLGGDPDRLLGRRQPRGISPDPTGRLIRERVAADLTLLGATRREILMVIGGSNPTSVRKLVRDADARSDLRRYFSSLDYDSGLEEERAKIRLAIEAADREDNEEEERAS